MNKKLKQIIGWTTFAISLSIISFWSYWGVNEAFHEGWYHTSLLQNLTLTFIQYLSIPAILLALSLIAITHKKTGTALIAILTIFTIFFFNSNAGRLLIAIPLILLASGFYFGKFKHKKIIIPTLIIIPLLIILTFAIPQLIKVETRYNDNNFQTRTIEGNNITLTWAPQGTGFPLDGTDWQTAKDNCESLNDETDNWRLPSREEIVQSMTKNNQNSKGYLDGEIAKYQTAPDKETPLWNPHSQIIYYWTSESKDEQKAYLVAYNGFILQRSKTSGANYQGYRCVKSNNEISSFQECAAAGNPIMESYPRQCQANGKLFIEELKN